MENIITPIAFLATPAAWGNLKGFISEPGALAFVLAFLLLSFMFLVWALKYYLYVPSPGVDDPEALLKVIYGGIWVCMALNSIIYWILFLYSNDMDHPFGTELQWYNGVGWIEGIVGGPLIIIRSFISKTGLVLVGGILWTILGVVVFLW